ncbi:MAG TPA: hemolysin family protein [Gemmatimonadales bacterium]|jgi:CBS domain containing-hemolysin-like protein
MSHLTTSSLIWRGVALLTLVAANAFFVAAEFSLVASRRTRIDAMVRKGDRKAKTVQTALQDLYRQLSATQLGITLCAVLLGYVAEDTVGLLFTDLASTLPPALAFLARAGVASTIAVAVVSAFHVVLGEQTPKAWAITYPEATSRWVAGPIMFIARMTRPVTGVLSWSSGALVRMLGVKAGTAELERVHSPDEIVMLVKQSQQVGHLAKGDVRLIEGVFEFTEKNARDVMTPRTDVVALASDLTVAEAADRVAQAGRSRYPVYRESLDDIVGFVHAKQILASMRQNPSQPILDIVRDVLFVPGAREVEDVLADMKRQKRHLAVVLDEYGGTAGIVTMEDLLEEIVGQIYDEYDRPEPVSRPTADGVTLEGSLSLDEANEQFALGVVDDVHQTIGGHVFGKLGRLPKVGDRVSVKAGALEVTEMLGRRVGKLKLVKAPAKP